jgi:hypothetical protein
MPTMVNRGKIHQSYLIRGTRIGCATVPSKTSASLISRALVRPPDLLPNN